MRSASELEDSEDEVLAELPFAQKILLLENLRERSLVIAASPLRRQCRQGIPDYGTTDL